MPVYCWSSEPKGKEKNNFDNIIMEYWYFFLCLRIIVLQVNCIQVTNYNCGEGEVNGNALWYFGVMGYLASLFIPL